MRHLCLFQCRRIVVLGEELLEVAVVEDIKPLRFHASISFTMVLNIVNDCGGYFSIQCSK